MTKRKSEGLDRSAEPDDGPGANGVGYRNPPQHTRFQPGQSGNPRGRPRDAKGWKQIVARIANEMHWVVEEGSRRRRSTLELILLQLRNLMAQGNDQAFRAYHNLFARYSPQETKTHRGYLIVPEQLTLEEWQREMVKVEAYQRRLIEEAEREEGKM